MRRRQIEHERYEAQKQWAQACDDLEAGCNRISQKLHGALDVVEASIVRKPRGWPKGKPRKSKAE